MTKTVCEWLSQSFDCSLRKRFSPPTCKSKLSRARQTNRKMFIVCQCHKSQRIRSSDEWNCSFATIDMRGLKAQQCGKILKCTRQDHAVEKKRTTNCHCWLFVVWKLCLSFWWKLLKLNYFVWRSHLTRSTRIYRELKLSGRENRFFLAAAIEQSEKETEKSELKVCES